MVLYGKAIHERKPFHFCLPKLGLLLTYITALNCLVLGITSLDVTAKSSPFSGSFNCKDMLNKLNDHNHPMSNWSVHSNNCSIDTHVTRKYISDGIDEIERLKSEFVEILTRYDCDNAKNTYSSAVSTCENCLIAYDQWLCARFLHGELDSFKDVIVCWQGRQVMPCLRVCEAVMTWCPYIHPQLSSPSNGEPAFFCYDENVVKPKITNCYAFNTLKNCPSDTVSNTSSSRDAMSFGQNVTSSSRDVMSSSGDVISEMCLLPNAGRSASSLISCWLLFTSSLTYFLLYV